MSKSKIQKRIHAKVSVTGEGNKFQNPNDKFQITFICSLSFSNEVRNLIVFKISQSLPFFEMTKKSRFAPCAFRFTLYTLQFYFNLRKYPEKQKGYRCPHETAKNNFPLAVSFCNHPALCNDDGQN